MRIGWRPGADPGRFALKAALRAAIVLPLVFAFADLVIGNVQTALFAGFGAFGMLVLVDFGGPRRARLFAHLGLAGIGAVLIVIGTLCSRSPWLAAGATLIVGFAILFSGVLNGWCAAGGNAAIVAFVLPVALAADPDVIPDCLLGWAIAAVAATAAQLLLFPSRPRDRVRAAAGEACAALADVMDPGAAGATSRDRPGTASAETASAGMASAAAASRIGESDDRAARLARADAALAALDRQLLAGPYRPTGSTGAMTALALLGDELAWFRAAAVDGHDCDGETTQAVAAALRASAATLTGRHAAPDLDRLDAAREAQRQQLAGAVAELCTRALEQAPHADVVQAFRLYTAARSAGRIGRSALQAAGRAAPAPAGEALVATQRLAVEHASPGSVWFRNSVRGAVALAVAVYVAQRSGVQHSFWVVLGVLSVLRSSALGTGATIVQALAGTAVGIVVGGLVVIVIPTGSAFLWVVFPFAVLLAAYAPRAISFAAGQAGFTLVLVILFNLQQPTGWEIGVTRIEDVAIGFAISLAIGLLFWPRGAGALLRRNLDSAYARADELLVAARRLLADAAASDGREVEQAERAAAAAADRLDDAFRQYLAERPAGRLPVSEVATLVSGATRVRRTARALLDGRSAAAPLAAPERTRFAQVWASLYLDELARLERRLDEPAAVIGLRLPPVDGIRGAALAGAATP
ncbi:FUSC family protein [Conexibacter sp. CPCC 206217]|uniref:FUSC family protein n=1 Tax=Conexibacter sp. CPCC 206217 TaxID=3064574 RepID=UPI002723E437|nr:FUSC family protein [Conexibacter sp. CPCC 206217]MDO8213684.1 FUSC family protein [Conexibacter sp. CPCC 206217]